MKSIIKQTLRDKDREVSDEANVSMLLKKILEE